MIRIVKENSSNIWTHKDDNNANIDLIISDGWCRIEGEVFELYGASSGEVRTGLVSEIIVEDASTGSGDEVFSNGVDLLERLKILDYPYFKSSSNTNSINQGYFGLLTDFYFGGSATETVVELNDVDTWVDVNFDINAEGTFDYRPQAMKQADALGYDTSTQLFNLEGLTLENFGSFRASMSFDPDEDDGELSARLQFERHSGTTPNDPFPIEDIVASMSQGADTSYPIEPFLSFFIGDTIDTNGSGDAGKCKFQIKSSVPGTVSMRALTWYINK